MTLAIKIVAFDPTYPLNGRYLMDFDVSAYDPYSNKSGPVPTTDKIAEAKHFSDLLDALEFWKPRLASGGSDQTARLTAR